jgi:hypothetical protein
MFERGRAEPMVRPGRAALADLQKRGHALGVDLWQVPQQDSAHNTHALEYGLALRRIGFLS